MSVESVFVYDWSAFTSKFCGTSAVRLFCLDAKSRPICLTIPAPKKRGCFFYVSLPLAARVRKHGCVRFAGHECSFDCAYHSDFSYECSCVTATCGCPVDIERYSDDDWRVMRREMYAILTTAKTTYKTKAGPKEKLIFQFTSQEMLEVVQMRRLRVEPSHPLGVDIHSRCPYIKFTSNWRPRDASKIFERPVTLRGKLAACTIEMLDVRPDVMLATVHDIPTCGWVKFSTLQLMDPDVMERYAARKETELEVMHCEQYVMNWNEFPSRSDAPCSLSPTVFCFDIEVNSEDPTRFPDASKDDEIFQISIVVGGLRPRRILLTLGNPDPATVEAEVLTYPTEADLIGGFCKILLSVNPVVVTGYNIFGFDLPYLFKRAVKCDQANVLLRTSMFHELSSDRPNGFVTEYDGDESMDFKRKGRMTITTPGRIWIDVLDVVKESFKLPSYKLEAVASRFIGLHKDPIKPKDIFEAYRIGVRRPTPDGVHLLGLVGKYCVVDADITLRLFEKLQVWTTCVEFAGVCSVLPNRVFGYGQQGKVFAQIARYCIESCIVMNKPTDAPKEGYTGAEVLEPVPGFYKDVLLFDFASLYPTIIVAFNIDYSTITGPETDPELCNLVSWTDPDGTSHAYRFLKQPRGVLPTLVENLMEQRKATRALMKTIPKDDFRWTLLEQRQLSYKIAANSIYGTLGLHNGIVRFMEGAASITATGRHSLKRAINTLEHRYGGKVIYGDTDSTFVTFPPSDEPNYDRGRRIEKELVEQKMFPAPMKLEFENMVYSQFLILKKKRYIWKQEGEDGSAPIHRKGIGRRTTSQFTLDLGDELIDVLFKNSSSADVADFVVAKCLNALHRQVPIEKFVVSSEVKTATEYKTRPLPLDPKLRQKRLELLGCGEGDYQNRALPAHIQLADRVRSRGVRVDNRSRIEYVYFKSRWLSGQKRRLADRIEEYAYMCSHADVLHVDYLHYIKEASSFADDVLEIAFGAKKMFSRITNVFFVREVLVGELRNLCRPRVELVRSTKH